VLVIGALSIGAWCLGGVGKPDPDKLAQSSEAPNRVQSVEILRTRSDEETGQKLFRMTGDKDTRVAMAAVWALTQRRRPEERKLVEQVLADTQRHSRVRAEAATGMGLFKQTSADQQASSVILVQALSSEKDARVRAGAAKGLMALRDLTSVAALAKALEDPDEHVRNWAIGALNKMMVRRFPYDPKVAPEDQRKVIAEIQHYASHSSEHNHLEIKD
jgi:HEAT repeat protein